MALVIAEGPQLPSEEGRLSMIEDLTRVTARYLGLSHQDIVVLIREEGGDRMATGKGDVIGWDFRSL